MFKKKPRVFGQVSQQFSCTKKNIHNNCLKEVGIVRIIVFLLHKKSEWSDRASARKDEGLRAALVERDNLFGHELIVSRANS